MGNMQLKMTEQADWFGGSFMGGGVGEGDEGSDRPLVLSTVYSA